MLLFKRRSELDKNDIKTWINDIREIDISSNKKYFVRKKNDLILEKKI